MNIKLLNTRLPKGIKAKRNHYFYSNKNVEVKWLDNNNPNKKFKNSLYRNSIDSSRPVLVNVSCINFKIHENNQCNNIFIIPEHTIFSLQDIEVMYPMWRIENTIQDLSLHSDIHMIFDSIYPKIYPLTELNNSSIGALVAGFYRGLPRNFHNVMILTQKNGDNVSLSIEEFQVLSIDEYYQILDFIKILISEMVLFYKEQSVTELSEEELNLLINRALDIENAFKFRAKHYNKDIANIRESLIKSDTIYSLANAYIPITKDKNFEQKTLNETITINDSALDIIREYRSYSVDLVKMMEYPSMVDLNIPETNDLDVKINHFSLKIEQNTELTIEEYALLKTTYNLAFNKAKTIKLTGFNTNQRTNVKDAKQMLLKASHEGTPLPEKEASVKGMILKLEGILPISEESLDWLKNKTGVLEIEA